MSFPYLSFAYRAFIPQSIGRSLSDIFRCHPYFNRQDLVNYDEFANFLRNMDAKGRVAGRGGNWIAEPAPFSTLLHTFAMTNDGEFDAGIGFRSHTTGKVSIEGRIDLREVGQIPTLFSPINIPGKVEAFQCRAGIVPQTSNLNVGYPGIQTTTGKFIGVFKESESKQSIITGYSHVENKSEGPYFSQPATSVPDMFDTTIITARAAGSYPFIKLMAPDIDMQLTVKLRRWGERIEIHFEGKHDQFPAYELIINGKRRMRWDPVAKGQLGPNLLNLNANYWGTQVRTSYTMSEWLPFGYKPSRKQTLFRL